MVGGGEQEAGLEIQSDHVHCFPARKRRDRNRSEDANEIVSGVNSDAFRVSGITREYQRLLELRAFRSAGCPVGTIGEETFRKSDLVANQESEA